MIRVKICGITNRDDAMAAVDAGADLIGFIFAPSPRQVDRATAARIIAGVGTEVTTVGVFVDAQVDDIQKAYEECGIAIAQLHGQESPVTVELLGAGRVWKAFRIRDESDLEGISSYGADLAGVFLDAYSRDRAGGTGQTFDWRLAAKAPRNGVPLILAGGLTPANVGAAIAQAQPDIVDVSSGVESSPGRKDVQLVRSFIRAARAASAIL